MDSNVGFVFWGGGVGVGGLLIVCLFFLIYLLIWGLVVGLVLYA